MAFGAIEVSEERGEPFQLYLFRYGPDPDDYFAYTNAEEDKRVMVSDIGGQIITYEAVQITSGNIVSSGALDNQQWSVMFPDVLQLTEAFRQRAPSYVVTLTVWSSHETDTGQQFIVEWSGRVIGFGIEGDEVELNCEPISLAMQRNGLRRHWQYGCPLPLYSQGVGLCNASRAAATAPFKLASVAGKRLEIDLTASRSAFGASALYDRYENIETRSWFVGGVVEFFIGTANRELRTIIKLTGDQIQMAATIEGLTADDTVNLVYGCNHKTGLTTLNDGGHCLPVHNNIKNFGGQPWIPTENPIGMRNIYR